MPLETLRQRDPDSRPTKVLDAEALRARSRKHGLWSLRSHYQRTRPYLLPRRVPGSPLLRLGHGLGPLGSRRDYMHDLEAARLELVQNVGQSQRGRRLDVMQQQDALPARLDAADRATRHFAVVDVRPVVGEKIDAPGHVVVRGEVLLGRGPSQQAGDTEERRDRLLIAPRAQP